MKSYDGGVKVDKVWLSFIAFAKMKRKCEKNVKSKKVVNFIVYEFDFAMQMLENEMEIEKFLRPPIFCNTFVRF